MSNHPTAVADVGKVDVGKVDVGMVDTAGVIDVAVVWVDRNCGGDDNDCLVASGPYCWTTEDGKAVGELVAIAFEKKLQKGKMECMLISHQHPWSTLSLIR